MLCYQFQMFHIIFLFSKSCNIIPNAAINNTEENNFLFVCLSYGFWIYKPLFLFCSCTLAYFSRQTKLENKLEGKNRKTIVIYISINFWSFGKMFVVEGGPEALFRLQTFFPKLQKIIGYINHNLYSALTL